MLKACEECGRTVSDRAAACPECGCPMAAADRRDPRGVRTIQATGKGWKAAQVVGVLVGLLGCSWVLAADPQSTGADALVAAAGWTLWLAARVGAWWDHG